MSIELVRDQIWIDGDLSISFQRTERVDDGIIEAAPSSLGILPILTAPVTPPNAVMLDFLVAIGRDESWWLGLNATRLHAVAVAIGGENAIGGGPAAAALSDQPRGYVVCPPPRAVFGLRVGEYAFRQFTPETTPVSIGVHPLRKDWRHDPAIEPEAPSVQHGAGRAGDDPPAAADLPIDAWDLVNRHEVRVGLIGPEEYRRLSGRDLPPPAGPDERYVPRLFP
jgi:hypothetical protein